MTDFGFQNVRATVPLGRLLIVTVALILLGGVAGVILIGQSRSAAGLEEVRRECAELRAELEARDRTLATLQADVRRVQATALSRPSAASQGVSPTDPGLELVRRMTELTTLHSNTAALVEKLLARAADPEPPEEAARQRQAVLISLEAMAHGEEQKLDAAKRRAAELLVGLNVPAEISTMDVNKALDTASLRAYWPYFEAKQERDTLQMSAQRWRLRLTQEQIDAEIETARKNRP